MRKALTASLLIGALSACSSGAPSSIVPQPAASVASVVQPVPRNSPADSCPLVTTRGSTHVMCGGGDGEGSANESDDSGDDLSQSGGGFNLEGSPLENGGFDTSNFQDDFGTMTWNGADTASFSYFTQIEGYPPMSQACINDLNALNSSFLNFMIAGFSALIGGSYAGIVAKARKVGVISGTGIAASNVGQIASLNAAQLAVNADCSGQGAGQSPGGPLPPGYAPAP